MSRRYTQGLREEDADDFIGMGTTDPVDSHRDKQRRQMNQQSEQTPAVPVVTKDTMPPESEMSAFVKTTPTLMVRVSGPFKVETSEGVLECPDGWLAIDSEGNPYPISAEVQAATYQPVAAGVEGEAAPPVPPGTPPTEPGPTPEG